MKNYFPHDSDARSDDKIISLRIKHKWEGYGLYWALIEKLRDSKNYTLKLDYNVLAFDLRSDAALIKSIINDFGLFSFTENGECFYSKSLNMRMKPMDDKKAKLSNAGKRGNEMRWKESKQVSPPNRQPIKNESLPEYNNIATQSPPDSHPIAKLSQEEIREEDIKKESPNGDKKEVQKKKGYDLSFVDEGFKDLFSEWLEYKRERRENYKSEKSLKTCYNRLLKLSEYDAEKARLIIEQSIASNYAGLFELKNYGSKRTTTNIYEQKRIDSERRKSQLMAEFAEADAKFLAEQEAKRKADCSAGEIPNTFKNGG